ncbi:HAD family hydrolase [Paenibacillus methanolicus]|uniref:Putative hydrolase of the HAD superfamily n=1 Tax=Paenibacillus methanolicus TaxID=582686 RepID=A0A5S5BWI5_9BACL|nr:HAD family hydrolase [Paenibacillus methanolicus]TYP70656.1 putative hydrolase of the HAD superfamily [Paenibacillus methanolicus]
MNNEASRNIGRFEAVFFDLDDTMYDSLSPFRKAALAVLALPADFPLETAYRRVRYHSDRLWEIYAEGHMELEEMRVQRVILAFHEFGLTVSREQSAAVQARYIEEQGRIELSDGVLEAIALVREAGLGLGMITNGPVEHQMAKIRALGLDRIVAADRIFISDGVGIAKPDPRIFKHVSDVTGHAQAVCLYIGDSWRNDIAGAMEAGWRSVWLNRRGAAPDTDHAPHAEIRDISELPTLLKTWL